MSMMDLGNEAGERPLTVSIAGTAFSFLPDRGLSSPGFDHGGSEFPEDAGEKVRLRVHGGPAPEMETKEKIFDSGQTWSLYRSSGKVVLQNDTLEPGSNPDRFVLLEPDLRSGDVYLADGALDGKILSDSLGYPLNQVLMILLLSAGQGMLLHACGIEDHGEGYLFLGNSTHGKSTMASLWFQNHATVLNDDRVIIRDQDETLWMYGTPWHGDFRAFSTRGLPVSKIFFLRHGETNSATFKKGAEAVSMIIARSFPPLWDKKGMAYTIDLCHRMVKKTPCHELSFKPDKSVVDFVRRL